jgi:hypothetical protein
MDCMSESSVRLPNESADEDEEERALALAAAVIES